LWFAFFSAFLFSPSSSSSYYYYYSTFSARRDDIWWVVLVTAMEKHISTLKCSQRSAAGLRWCIPGAFVVVIIIIIIIIIIIMDFGRLFSTSGPILGPRQC
jgi:hypothetical protein